MNFNAEGFARALRTQTLGRSLDIHQELPSTMDIAWQAIEQNVPHGHLVVANSQTAGRGSYGRFWVSPPDTNLYFSIVSTRRSDGRAYVCRRIEHCRRCGST